jgi:hypothetical protein
VEKRILPAVLFAAVRARLGKWDVIHHAIDDTARTVRLVAILVAVALNTAGLAVLTWFLARR